MWSSGHVGTVSDLDYSVAQIRVALRGRPLIIWSGRGADFRERNFSICTTPPQMINDRPLSVQYDQTSQRMGHSIGGYLPISLRNF